MAKHSRNKSLAEVGYEAILVDLCEALATLESAHEAAKLLVDLLSPQEIEMIAKRLKIARLLLERTPYADICRELRVSKATVARVSVWLAAAGDGYRLACQRAAERRPAGKPNEEHSSSPPFALSRSVEMYFWPGAVVRDLVQTATGTQRKRILRILAKASTKPAILAQIAETPDQDQSSIP